MTKRTRQYLGLLCAAAAYYIVHEGAHPVYALCLGVFKQINIMGLGIQINIYADRLTETRLGIFCLMGVTASQIAAYAMVLLTNIICRSPSNAFRACCYYITPPCCFLTLCI